MTKIIIDDECYQELVNLIDEAKTVLEQNCLENQLVDYVLNKALALLEDFKHA